MKVFIAIVNALDVSADVLRYDNLAHAHNVFTGELAQLLSDCSEIETRVICDVSKALKDSMRKRR